MAQAERHRRGQPHPAAWHRRAGVRLGLGCLAFGEDARRAHRQHPPGLGQREAARGPMDQPLTQPRLKPLHGLRHRRAGQAELGGGGGEGAGFGHLGEDRPGFQVGQGHGDASKIGNDDFPSFLFSASSVEHHLAPTGRTRPNRRTAMIERRKFAELGGADHGWLKAKHHFSFANYYDPQRMGWGASARLERRRDRRQVRLPAASARRHGDHHLCPRRRDHPPGLHGQQGPHRGRRRAGDVRRLRRASLRVQPGRRDDADLPDLDRADRDAAASRPGAPSRSPRATARAAS